MSKPRSNPHRLLKKIAGIAFGSVFIINLIGTCDSILVSATRFVDPCGTILANCQPGEFLVSRSEPGDFCIDPGCTVPGACDDPPLGLTVRVCP